MHSNDKENSTIELTEIDEFEPIVLGERETSQPLD
jgi:hypothetical protein